MFAVPGWSVSASELQKQNERPSAPEKPAQDQGVKETGSGSNKRKRGSNADQTGGKVTKGNVQEMWSRYIEGNTQNGNKAKTVKGQDGQKKNSEKKNGKQAKATDSSTNDTSQKDDVEAQEDKSKGAENAQQKPEKKKARKSSKKRKLDAEKAQSQANSTGNKSTPGAPPSPAAATEPSNLTPLQQSMRQKLLSARFRHLNETLYTAPSSEALELFTANPEFFAEYHAGFSRQVKEYWPSNPVDAYISAVKTRGKIRIQKQGRFSKGKGGAAGGLPPLPRRPSGLCTIADLGCGDAQFARALTPTAKKLDVKLLSFDLHAPDPLITKADISALPQQDGSVDVAVFCLSLMGTNWVSFVEEAWRILRGDGKGECWVSEVKSRFGKVARKAQIGKTRPQTKKEKAKKKEEEENDLGETVFAEDMQKTADDDTDITAFIEVFRTRGFVLKQETVDKSNKMFVKMEFVKTGFPTKGKWAGTGRPLPQGNMSRKKFIEPVDSGLTPEEESKVLKPCVYKTR